MGGGGGGWGWENKKRMCVGRVFRGLRGYHAWSSRARIIRRSFTPKPRPANPKTENPLDRCAVVVRYPAASDTLRNSTRTDRSRSSERPPFGQTRGFLPQAETPTPTERHRALPTRFRHDPRICDTPCRASVAWMRVIRSIINDNAGGRTGRQAGRRAVGRLGSWAASATRRRESRLTADDSPAPQTDTTHRSARTRSRARRGLSSQCTEPAHRQR